QIRLVFQHNQKFSFLAVGRFLEHPGRKFFQSLLLKLFRKLGCRSFFRFGVGGQAAEQNAACNEDQQRRFKTRGSHDDHSPSPSLWKWPVVLLGQELGARELESGRKRERREVLVSHSPALSPPFSSSPNQ